MQAMVGAVTYAAAKVEVSPTPDWLQAAGELCVCVCVFAVGGCGCIARWRRPWRRLSERWDPRCSYRSSTRCGLSESPNSPAQVRLLSSAHSPPVSGLTCLSYLLFSCSPQASAASRKLFSDLLQRCLSTVPTRLELPFNPAEFWSCYRFHNKVRPTPTGFMAEPQLL